MDAVSSQSSAPVRDKLLDTGSLSIERLPMLSVIFERLSTACADYLRHQAASPMYFSVKRIQGCRITELLDGYEHNAIAAVFNVPEWDNSIVIGMDRSFVYTLVEVLYGADGSEPPVEIDRAFSSLELKMAQGIFGHIARAFETAFSVVSPAVLKLDRIETRMDFATIGRKTNQAVAARIELQALNRTGELFVVIPQSVIMPMRNVLATTAGDAGGRDPKWASLIQAEVKKTSIRLNAVLDEKSLTLGDIAQLEVGQVIRLEATPKSKIRVEGNNQKLFVCSMGHADGRYVLKVDDVVDQKDEYLDDILSR